MRPSRSHAQQRLEEERDHRLKERRAFQARIEEEVRENNILKQELQNPNFSLNISLPEDSIVTEINQETKTRRDEFDKFMKEFRRRLNG